MDKQLVPTERELAMFFADTSKLLQKREDSRLSQAATAIVDAGCANELATNVEFWNWMSKNYPNRLFNTEQIQETIIAKPGWRNIIQGKGHEWDYMQKLRNNPKNIFTRVDAGNIPNRKGFDIVQKNIFSGEEVAKFQNKAYTSSSNPGLHNAPHDTTVVTNAEKVDYVTKQGYEVESFQTTDEIIDNTNVRMEQAESGNANTSYNLKNVGGTMAKAGAIGFVISGGVEAVASYREWKCGNIDDDEYIKRIALSGGNGLVTSAATSGIMVPIVATITAAGLAVPLTIPISFVVGSVIDKIVAPMFGRGEYKKIFNDAKYYQNLELANKSFVGTMKQSQEDFRNFVYATAHQAEQFAEMKKIDDKLSDTYNQLTDSIVTAIETSATKRDKFLTDNKAAEERLDAILSTI